MSVIIETAIRYTHQSRERIEAWAYVGQPFEEWPDWLRSHYENQPGADSKKARVGHWAMRDDEGFFGSGYIQRFSSVAMSPSP